MRIIQDKTQNTPDDFTVSIWFPVYAIEEIANMSYLSNEEVGIYFKFLCHCWRSNSGLKNNVNALSRLAGVTPQKWKKIQHNILQFFIIKDDALIHETLELQRNWAILNRMKKQVAAYIKHGNREKAQEIADKYNAILAQNKDTGAGKIPMHLHCPITVTRTLTSLTIISPSSKGDS